MFFLKSNKFNYGINIPTSFNEITQQNLLKLTAEVTLKPHHTLICLVYKTNLFKLASQVNGGLKDENIGVTPIVVKVADADDTIHSPVKECRPIIAPSVLERGYEVFVPTAASLNAVMGYIQHDNDLRVELFQKKYKGNLAKGVDKTFIDAIGFKEQEIIKDNNTDIYLLGFKIVGNNDIVATVPLKQEIDDVYYVKSVD